MLDYMQAMVMLEAERNRAARRRNGEARREGGEHRPAGKFERLATWLRKRLVGDRRSEVERLAQRDRSIGPGGPKC